MRGEFGGNKLKMVRFWGVCVGLRAFEGERGGGGFCKSYCFYFVLRRPVGKGESKNCAHPPLGQVWSGLE